MTRDPDGESFAMSVLELTRKGEIASARQRVEARAARSADDVYAAAAGLALERIVGPDGRHAAPDPDRTFSRALAAGDPVAIATSAAPYARWLRERGRVREARDAVNAALHHAGGLDTLHGLALAGASLGDRSLDARILATLDGCVDDRVDAIAGARAHARALIELAAGDTARAREYASKARTSYGRAGWPYYAALADEIAGNATAAARLFKQFGAIADAERASASAASGRTENELSLREREVATAAARGASNAAIATSLSISRKTVEKHLSSVYRKLAVTNRVELAAAMDATAGLAKRRLLPAPLSPFVGRLDDLENLARCNASYRLVTLTGAGGSGKTRAALEFAHRQYERLAGEVWFVDLSSVHDVRGVVPAIAATIVPSETRQDARSAVFAHLATHGGLVVLDNCEQLVPDLTQVLRDVLDEAPGVRIVATSRQRIGFLGEYVVRFGPMDADDAVALFHERARAAGSEADDRAMVGRICDRVDCVPLAIELAAARLYDMTLAQLEDALASSASVLRTDDPSATLRHRSIDAMIEWGYDALDERSRRFCRSVAIFDGSFTFEHVAGAFGTGAEVALAQLHRTSLIERLTDGRYRMLRVVRDVALALLRAEDEEPAAFAAYAEHYRTVLERAHDTWFDMPIEAWLMPLRDELPNIEAALRWCFSRAGDTSVGIALAAVAARLWNEVGRESELRPFLERAVALEREGSRAERVRLLLAWSRYHDVAGDYTTALGAAERALALCDEHTEARDLALALLAVGCCHAARSDTAAEAPLARALGLTRELGMKRSEATALMALAMLAPTPAAAAAMFAEVLTIARLLDNRLLEAIALINLAEAYGLDGDDERAVDHARRAVEALERLGAQTRLARARITLAEREEARGDMRPARNAAARAFLDLSRAGDAPFRAKAASVLARTLPPAEAGLASRLEPLGDDLAALARDVARLLD